jgi:hypothetical protein
VRYSTDSTEMVQLVPKFQMGEGVECSTFHPTPSPADLRKDENNWLNERADVQQFHLLFLKCSSAVWSVQSARIKQIVLEVAFEWMRKGGDDFGDFWIGKILHLRRRCSSGKTSPMSATRRTLLRPVPVLIMSGAYCENGDRA